VEVPRNPSPDQSTFGSALQETPAQVSIVESREILDEIEESFRLEEMELIAGPSGVSEVNTQQVLKETTEPEQSLLEPNEVPQNSTSAKQKYVSINESTSPFIELG
jgi:hypothetical protein